MTECVWVACFFRAGLCHPRASPRRPHVLFSACASPARGLCDTTYNLHGRTGSCEIFPQETCESAAALPGAGISGETQTSRDHMVLTQVSTPDVSRIRVRIAEITCPNYCQYYFEPHTGAQGSRPAPALGSRLAGASAAPGSRLARLPAPASRARRHLAPAPLSDGGEQRAPHRPPSGIR